ncbi:AER099Cp [Eremothecium gossypii ATCC 10895]|uniref:AER099Cp n=1 Tax=Eremothecium gossypii (strain ATCC 10895 / CBS 109.51 / FGSC 9923 / NRRL Y-1056) TaxID=284811 RepID=Q757B4_EREGS|nr:AER099Cp [Eremothecium gossypii ATCC 10895]AAS52783.1 AER099Cp [Eremothecium gossypii ATCC 10895]AEY97089.1 FAER099Cp [Eremothecium gossypii FDAG1]
MLPREAVVAHVGALREGSAELRELLALLPEGVRRDRGMLLECVRGPFFTQAVDGLSRQLRAREAAYGLAQALRYPYRGEGVNGFLDGVREQGRRERAERDGAERE